MDAQIDTALDREISFILEADRLKSVLRASVLADRSRRENSGEHSWHVALAALVLSEHAQPGVSVDRAIRMLLLHDLVEIDAGDAPIHSTYDHAAQEAKERAAAARIFGFLPEAHRSEFHALWEEFEDGTSPDAAFARAVDRALPMLLNLASGGGTWDDYDVTLAQIDDKIGPPVARGLPGLWPRLRARVAPWFVARGRG